LVFRAFLCWRSVVAVVAVATEVRVVVVVKYVNRRPTTQALRGTSVRLRFPKEPTSQLMSEKAE
jgi:hypothetical protein